MPSTPRSMKTPQMANSRKNSPANTMRDMDANDNGHPNGSFRPPFLLDEDEDGDLPTNVSRVDQLYGLPPECLNHDDVHKPLRHLDDQGNEYHYSLNPMMYSVGLILVVELLERFSFYGIYYTQTLYLTGVYDAHWNAGLSSVDAASFVSLSTMVAYTTPFVGAILADTLWGDYSSILYGSVGLYLPGVLLVALTTIPHLLGATFNLPVLAMAVLFLWPLGTGIVKSVVNVFGAKQFHPLLQSSMIEQYYVNFYMAINIGALAGITFVPIIAQYNVTKAYLLPCGLLTLGIMIFISGTPRYVISKPRGDLHLSELCLKKKKEDDETTYMIQDPNMPPPVPLSQVFRITLLIVPFCIAYSQMPTTFIVQGTVMHKAFGFVDAATMNGLDPISVLIFGNLTGNIISPALAKRDIKLPTTYKFAIGSSLGVLAVIWAMLVEHWIHVAYHEHDGQSLCILWQAPSYVLIGWGEIFAVSAAYEVAFTASSPETKALASALNIFCVGGIPNFICIFLYQVCQGWFRNSRGDTNLQHLEDYATASVGKYFAVLLGILLLGVGLNVYGPIRRFVESTEQQAAELVKTPILRRTPQMKQHKAAPGGSGDYADEESPLIKKKNAASPLLNTEKAAAIKAQQHQQYLKYGKGPVLNKMGSMRAGLTLAHKESKKKAIKKSWIHKLYGGTDTTSTPTGVGTVVTATGQVMIPPSPARSSTLVPPKNAGANQKKLQEKFLGHRAEST